MSTEIERHEGGAVLPAAMPDRQQQRWADELTGWAAAAQRAHEIACVLCETSFVPKSMAHRPGDVTGAILTAMELDVPIMWGLSNIDIVDGSPAIRARALRGLLKRAGHEIWVEESTATRAVVCARHKGSQRVERSVWTIDRAKKAELLGKKNWRLYPQDMLVNRATAEAARLAAPDVLMGVAYTVDELGGDETPDGGAPVTEERPAAAAKKRTAQRAKPEPGPAPEDLPTDMPAPISPAARPPIVAPFPPESLPSTCDLSMPHDDRFSPPHGCPPNCPTRFVHEGEALHAEAETERPTHAETEAEAVAMMNAAGLHVETLDVLDTLDTAPESMVTDGQRKRMAVEMRKAGIVDRDKRLAYVSDLIGRRVESGNELTVAEASRVIQALIDDATEEGLASVAPTEVPE